MTSGSRKFLADNTVRVARSFYTVPGKLWGRWADTFTNDNNTPVTLTVQYTTNLGSDDSGIIYITPGTGNKSLTSWDGSVFRFPSP